MWLKSIRFPTHYIPLNLTLRLKDLRSHFLDQRTVNIPLQNQRSPGGRARCGTLHKLFFKERDQSSKCRGCSLLTEPDCYTMSTNIHTKGSYGYIPQSLPSSPLFSTSPRSSTCSARHSLISANPTHYSPSHHARISEGRLGHP